MNGPSEFHVVGTLKDWNIVDRLGEIRVPTLVTLGGTRRGHAELLPKSSIRGSPNRNRYLRSKRALCTRRGDGQVLPGSRRFPLTSRAACLIHRTLPVATLALDRKLSVGW